MKKYATFLLLICLSALSVAQQKIVFISDTQEPMWVEYLISKKENNKAATNLLFTRILLENPAAVFFMGDMVASGKSDKTWQPIDFFLKELQLQNIPYHAIKGNHEYMFEPIKGIANYHKRFAEDSANVYVQIIDSVAVVMLNSNFSQLSKPEIQKMLNDYEALMDSLSLSDTVKFIVVGAHHSPYSNSVIVGVSADVQQKIVPKYLTTPKAVLFLSGHSHNIELFQIGGKYFSVIGGGGGARQALKKDGKQNYSDILPPEKRIRFFYASITRSDNTLVFKIHGMDADNLAEEKVTEILTIERK